MEKEHEETEGQLAIDVYQTESEIVIQAPIAGVKPENIEVSVSDEMFTVKGVRNPTCETKKEDYLTQECYWGAFSRSYLLPIKIDASKSSASLKDGILTVTVPKEETSKTKVLKIQTEE